MLAENFMTAAELQLPEEYHRALILTLRAGERGELVHAPEDILKYEVMWGIPDERLFLGRINMSNWRVGVSCGTVCCLGGAAEIIGNLPIWTLDKYAHDLAAKGVRGLRELFYPPANMDYYSITVEQAMAALRSYLTTGKPNWGET